MAGVKPRVKPGAGAAGAGAGKSEFGTKRRRDDEIRDEVERYTVSCACMVLYRSGERGAGKFVGEASAGWPWG
jgi:hypothetical protein